MITKDISKSTKVASLSKDSLILFLMIIPNLDSHGKMSGSPYSVKGQVVPRIKFFTIKTVERCLKEINEKTNIKWFQKDGLYWIHAINWKEHQNLNPNKIGRDELPSYSGLTTELVSHEVEVEVEGKVEEKGKEEAQVKCKGDSVEIPEDLQPNTQEIQIWLAYKQERKESYKPSGLNALWGVLRRIPTDQRKEAIENSMGSGYKGIFPPKGGRNGKTESRVTGAVAPIPGKYSQFG